MAEIPLSLTGFLITYVLHFSKWRSFREGKKRQVSTWIICLDCFPAGPGSVRCLVSSFHIWTSFTLCGQEGRTWKITRINLGGGEGRGFVMERRTGKGKEEGSVWERCREFVWEKVKVFEKEGELCGKNRGGKGWKTKGNCGRKRPLGDSSARR